MIIISPAKNLNTNVESFLNNDFTKPLFLKKTKQLLELLKNLNQTEIKNLMNVSDNLAELNYGRLKVHSTKKAILKPAVFLFSGDTFNGLEIRTFDNESLNFAQNRLRILSGLYGLLKPLDQISPYRLEMGTNIKFILGDELANFWKNEITQLINEDLYKNKDKYLFNLSSNEYFESIDKKKIKSKIINFDFKKLKNNSFSSVGMMIKKCRGSMAKFLITKEIYDLEKIKNFSEFGFNFYSYDKSLNKFIFVKND